MKNQNKGHWYLLFKGGSADARGQPDYFGRTEDEEVARKFYQEHKDNPYSNSNVIDTTMRG